MSEKEKPFTVSDRRHFTPDGEARGQEAPPAPDGPGEGTHAHSGSADAGQVGSARSVTFGEFILSLGAQAGMLLAGDQEGKEGPVPASIEGARQIISILEMLEEKTRGSRTAEEGRILDELLFQLRMGFVQHAGRR